MLEKVDFDFIGPSDCGNMEAQTVDEPTMSCDESNFEPQSAQRRNELRESELMTPANK